MSSGGKGGSTSSSVQVPQWLEDASKQNLSRADQIAQIGYTPYFGADVAALTAPQNAAMGNTNSAAQAFGLQGASGGMPAPQTFAGGVQGYSSAPMYQEAMAALQANNPGQYDAIAAMFLNPQTGAAPTNPFKVMAPPPAMMGGLLSPGGLSSGGEPDGGPNNGYGPSQDNYGGDAGFGGNSYGGDPFGGGLY
jgi:hypothetical protein